MLKLFSPLLTVLLLASIGFARMGRDDVPQGAEAYHAAVQAAAAELPYQFGTWVGVDAPFQREVVQILNPNVLLSRTYRDVETGRTGTLVLVHCSDARSLLGHYPPACYPAQGWTALGAKPKQIHSSSLSVTATEYVFSSEQVGDMRELSVLHFTALPDGQIQPDMNLLERYGRDNRTKLFGGASIQLIVDAGLPASEREEIYNVLVSVAASWVNSINRGSQA